MSNNKNDKRIIGNLLSAFDAFGQEAEGDTGIEVLKNAGLDFTVNKENIYTSEGVKCESGFRRMYRDDTGATLGVVKKGFVAMQPREMSEIGQRICKGRDVEWDRVGSTHGGARMMMSFRLPEEFSFGQDGKETMQTFFYLMNAHDGSSGMKIVPAPVRLFCSNQFAMLDGFLRKIGIDPKLLSIRHSAKMHDKVNQIINALDLCDNLTEKFTEMNNNLLQVEMSLGDRVEYYIDVLGLKKDSELVNTATNPYGLSTRGNNTLDDLMEVEKLGRNNVGDMDNTAFKAFSTVTDFIDHANVHNKDGSINNTRVESAIMGSSARMKNKAWDILDEFVEEQKILEVVA